MVSNESKNIEQVGLGKRFLNFFIYHLKEKKIVERNKSLIYAIRKDEFNYAKQLIEKGADINYKDDFGDTPLILAVSKEKANLELVELLINKGVNINYTTNSGSNALIEALKAGNKSIAEMLINKGINISQEQKVIITDPRSFGSSIITSPLIEATKKGFSDIVEILVDKGASLKSTNTRGANCLCIAACFHPYLVKYFISKNIPINSQDNDGETPLHYAIEKNSYEIAKILIENKADLNYKDNTGATPLHLACMKGDNAIELAKLLLDNGAFINAATYSDNRLTPLADTIMRKPYASYNLIKLLLEKGADRNANICFYQEDKFGDRKKVWQTVEEYVETTKSFESIQEIFKSTTKLE